MIEGRSDQACIRGRFGPRLIAILVIFMVALASPLGAHASGPTVEVGKSFFPSPVTISAGQSVTWVNKDNVAHFLAWELSQFPWSGRIDPGGTYRLVFKKVGTYNYYDQFYTSMTGTIIVTAAPAPTATPKPTPQPTAKPTAKATARPTAKPTTKTAMKATAKPTTKPTATTLNKTAAPASSNPAAAQVSASPDTSSGGVGATAGNGPGSNPADSALSLGAIVAVLGLAALAFLAGIGVMMVRGNSSPPTMSDAASVPLSAAPVARPLTPAPPPSHSTPSPAATNRRPRRPEPPDAERSSHPYDVDEDAPIRAARPNHPDDDVDP